MYPNRFVKPEPRGGGRGSTLKMPITPITTTDTESIVLRPKRNGFLN